MTKQAGSPPTTNRRLAERRGAKMRAAAAAMGWDEREVARQMEARLQHVQAWFAGTKRPTRNTLARFAALTGKPPEWFGGGKPAESANGLRDALAETIRAERHRRHCTQDELARHTGLNRIAIVRVEHGDSSTTLEQFAALAGGLGQTMTDLMEKVETHWRHHS